MLSSKMLTPIPISLLSIMIILYGAQSVPPQNCVCSNPHNIGPNGTVPCNNTKCSRGDNLACNATDPYNVFANGAFSFTLYNIPDESYFILFGCNCPGFKYNYGHGGYNGYIAVGGHNDYFYTYNSCSDFNPDLDLDNITICCNYCCGPAYIPASD
ncbi:unnamed protein product [Rotaria socialis]|uniref:Uncharacterized protein n=1 Tax=Rotaria socialis TaxID=392032 RepID=A0A821HPB5_9BILA|nr:unnamed protein product [Rotaria socialis]CAF4688414.1 unnamed protein product [Rotaria socialis]